MQGRFSTLPLDQVAKGYRGDGRTTCDKDAAVPEGGATCKQYEGDSNEQSRSNSKMRAARRGWIGGRKQCKKPTTKIILNNQDP